MVSTMTKVQAVDLIARAVEGSADTMTDDEVRKLREVPVEDWHWLDFVQRRFEGLSPALQEAFEALDDPSGGSSMGPLDPDDGSWNRT